ncbi:MAG: hypothetical protein WC805_02880 [Patescibacteria group bacterium]|jgi:tRNA nucleotidyltransferase/poly(A) polymerase
MEDLFAPVEWLQEAGYRAYLVGNQSRNAVLQEKPAGQDIDIATSALPREVGKILSQQQIVPARLDVKFGVVAFLWQGRDYEITTFREDIYDPQFNHIRRTPIEIKFHKDTKLDALRRDFTINAIYWNPKNNHFIDPVDGIKDLENKTLRFIGDAETRIKEDPLRVLRAIRFKYSLGLKYAATTLKALIKYGKLVHKLQPSLLKKEFSKIQNLPNYQEARRDMQEMGVIQKV